MTLAKNGTGLGATVVAADTRSRGRRFARDEGLIRRSTRRLLGRL